MRPCAGRQRLNVSYTLEPQTELNIALCYLGQRRRGTEVQTASQRGTARATATARCEAAVGVRREGRKETVLESPGRRGRYRSPMSLKSPPPRYRWANHQWSQINPDTQTNQVSQMSDNGSRGLGLIWCLTHCLYKHVARTDVV